MTSPDPHLSPSGATTRGICDSCSARGIIRTADLLCSICSAKADAPGAFFCPRCSSIRTDDTCALPPTGQLCPQLRDLPRDEIARRLRERAHDWTTDPDEQADTHGSPHDACMTARLLLDDAYMTPETPEGLALMLERLEAAAIALSLAQHRARLLLASMQGDDDGDACSCNHPDCGAC
jgi:hypothetical protein